MTVFATGKGKSQHQYADNRTEIEILSDQTIGGKKKSYPEYHEQGQAIAFCFFVFSFPQPGESKTDYHHITMKQVWGGKQCTDHKNGTLDGHPFLVAPDPIHPQRYNDCETDLNACGDPGMSP